MTAVCPPGPEAALAAGIPAAKVAVAAATYWVDKPFDYRIPPELAGRVVPGVRVFVPFGRGNRRTEGIVLAVTEVGADGVDRLKPVESVPDPEPILDAEQLRLAMWMRERFFCTVYDAVKAMLPSGLWFGHSGARRVRDKTVETACLAVPAEEAAAAAEAKRARAPQQAALLHLLCALGEAASAELLQMSGAGRSSLKALVTAGLVRLERRAVFRRPAAVPEKQTALPTLNAGQQVAFDGLCALLDGGAEAALLYGVTGSGKTTVYLHLIAELLRRGKGTILLVPEIALTPQMIAVFSACFGEEVAVLHSSLAAGERTDEWKRIRAGLARVVIGTRSAVFAPVSQLGAIVIDEEQEDTYKSENTPRYHARDVAKFRCVRNGALLLLGSATPGVPSYYAAQTGRYHLFTLPGRYNEQAMPAVRIVDMKRELRAGNGGSISAPLREALAENITRGEQSILFLNRRGAYRLVTCVACGYTYSCPNCSVSLSWHSSGRRLMCHYCGHVHALDATCPACGGALSFTGAGTETVVQELTELFPDTPILRMDADAVSAAGGHDVLFEQFRREKIPIMVGTQMVTKGLNFSNVTLVGVLSADQSLYAADYRASERTFSLLTQVIGRGGRGDRPGRAVIQTFTPENDVIRRAAAQDYPAFYAAELEMRRLQQTPPFADLFAVTASGEDEARVLVCIRAAREMLIRLAGNRPDVRILGPAPLPVVRVMGRYRYRITVSCRADGEMRGILSGVVIACSTEKEFRGVSVFADADPSD
ncbi:MAG: primosomal protein N' [Clostridiales bacterium]|nr:primosomal protein N' [Clostridiales bacterium]